MKNKSPSATKLSREGKLLLELQCDHGYFISRLPPKKSLGMLTTLPTSKKGVPGKTRLVRCGKLSVPEDSALGRALAAGTSAKAAAKPKTSRGSTKR